MRQFAERIRHYLFEEKPKTALVMYWAVTQLVVFYHSGVKTSVDSTGYVSNAKALLSSFILGDAHDIWYVSYTIALACALNFKNGLLVMTLIQIAFSGAALFALYYAGLRITKDNGAAFVGAFLYVFWFEIHTWNIFIYTESLFISCSLISFYFLVSSKQPLHYLLSFAAIIFTCLFRPVGFSFLVASLIYLIYKAELSPTVRRASIAAGFIFLTLLLNKMLGAFELIQSYSKAEIIYPDIKLLVETPAKIHLPADGSQPLISLLEFIFFNPVYFFKLCAVKLFLFFGHVKPYFSTIHNLYIVLILYPLYFLAFRATRSTIEKPVVFFLVSYICLQGITVMITTENWDGRFLLPALPFIFILSAIQINQFLKQ